MKIPRSISACRRWCSRFIKAVRVRFAGANVLAVLVAEVDKAFRQRETERLRHIAKLAKLRKLDRSCQDRVIRATDGLLVDGELAWDAAFMVATAAEYRKNTHLQFQPHVGGVAGAGKSRGGNPQSRPAPALTFSPPATSPPH